MELELNSVARFGCGWYVVQVIESLMSDEKYASLNILMYDLLEMVNNNPLKRAVL